MCDCSCDKKENFENFYPKIIKKTPMEIEGFQTKNINKKEVESFTNKYKFYLKNERKNSNGLVETLDDSCKYDASFNRIIDMHEENLNMRSELDQDLMELNKTKNSLTRDETRYKQMIEVRDLVLYTAMGLALYYIFIEL